MKRNNRSMLEGPLLSGIISYTVPIILTGLLQLLFNAADLVVVGQFCGSISVGAVGATGAVTNLVVNLFIGLSGGAGVAVAHGLGGRKDEEVSRTVHTAIPVAVIAGAFLTVLGLLFAEPMLRWMETPENVLVLSALYMKLYFCGMIFNIIADPLVGYFYKMYLLGVPQDISSALAKMSTVTTGVNAVVAVIAASVFYIALRPALKKSGLFVQVTPEAEKV